MLHHFEIVECNTGFTMPCRPTATAKMPSATRSVSGSTFTRSVTPSTKPTNITGTRRLISSLLTCSRFFEPMRIAADMSSSTMSGTR